MILKLIFLAVISCFGSDKAAIQRDNRLTILNPRQTDYHAVGFFIAEHDDRIQCTATYLSSGHVLTAAHCLAFYTEKRPHKNLNYAFWPGFNLQDSLKIGAKGKTNFFKNFYAEAPVKLKILKKGSYDVKCEDPNVSKAVADDCTDNDWALLKVVSGFESLKDGYSLLSPKVNLKKSIPIIPQYSRDRWTKQTNETETFWSPTMSLERDCKIRNIRAKRIIHTDCALGDIGSGSPLFVRVNNKLFIAGIASLGIGSYSSTPGDVVIVDEYIQDMSDTVFIDVRKILFP